MDLLPPFPGFTPAGLDFLAGLAANNDRAWFLPRKSVFEDEIRWPLQCLVAELAAEARARGLPYTGASSLFRIYRDVRFSSDKSPYKTHASAWMGVSADKDAPGGFYVRVKPGACMLGVGLWQPEKATLGRIRARLAADPDLGDALTERLAARSLVFGSDEALKRMPRGFEAEAESPAAPYLRWKSFAATRALPDAAMFERGLVAHALDAMEAGTAVLDLGR